MATSTTTAELTRKLAEKHRVLMLGGLAVISHGHSRPTYDADIWLDPALSPEKWSQVVIDVLNEHPGMRIVAIGTWGEVPPGELAQVIERDGVVRTMGAKQPLDIFRDPNELEIGDFDAVWERGMRLNEAAMQHPAEAVRVLATGYLKELAEDGDPYARDILNKNP